MTNQISHKDRKPDSPGQGSFNVTTTMVTNGNYGTPGQIAISLVVFADGSLTFTGLDGTSDTWVFTTSMAYPQVIPIATTAVTAQSGNLATLGNLKGIT